MAPFPLSASNDEFSQRQYQADIGAGPFQLDLFFVYEVDGEERCLGTPTHYSSVVLPAESQPSPHDQEVCLPETDNWFVADLVASGAWSNLAALEQAKETLHEEVFERHGLELSEVRTALKLVSTRLRELTR